MNHFTIIMSQLQDTLLNFLSLGIFTLMGCAQHVKGEAYSLAVFDRTLSQDECKNILGNSMGCLNYGYIWFKKMNYTSRKK